MTVGSLFAGIGGFEYAAEMAGFTPLWSNEIDKHACQVLRKNFTHEIIEEDIRRLSINPNSIRGRNGYRTDEKVPERHDSPQPNSSSKKRVYLPKVDIITGGFPCQPFSHAGKREGTQDDRYLWPEMLRIIREVRPSWVIGENVSGLLSMEDGKTLEQICLDLEGEGYEVQPYHIGASGVGAWHRRNRVWILAYCDNGQRKREGKEVCARGNAVDGSYAAVSADSESKRLQGRDNGGGFRKEKPRLRESCGAVKDKRESKPQLRGVGDGLPGGVDGFINRWSSQHPSPTTTRTKGRAARLKGLGNAIVPQVAYEFFEAIKAYEAN
jgi:DNA (cytosine-5)-methyltransferase 1